jgi:hypothetical protein
MLTLQRSVPEPMIWPNRSSPIARRETSVVRIQVDSPINAPGMSHQITITSGPIASSILEARTIVVTLAIEAEEAVVMVVEEAVTMVAEEATKTITERRTPTEVIRITLTSRVIIRIPIQIIQMIIIQQAAQTNRERAVAVNTSSWTQSGEHRMVRSLVHECK